MLLRYLCKPDLVLDPSDSVTRRCCCCITHPSLAWEHLGSPLLPFLLLLSRQAAVNNSRRAQGIRESLGSQSCLWTLLLTDPAAPRDPCRSVLSPTSAEKAAAHTELLTKLHRAFFFTNYHHHLCSSDIWLTACLTWHRVKQRFFPQRIRNTLTTEEVHSSFNGAGVAVYLSSNNLFK